MFSTVTIVDACKSAGIQTNLSLEPMLQVLALDSFYSDVIMMQLNFTTECMIFWLYDLLI